MVAHLDRAIFGRDGLLGCMVTPFAGRKESSGPFQELSREVVHADVAPIVLELLGTCRHWPCLTFIMCEEQRMPESAHCLSFMGADKALLFAIWQLRSGLALLGPPGSWKHCSSTSRVQAQVLQNLRVQGSASSPPAKKHRPMTAFG